MGFFSRLFGLDEGSQDIEKSSVQPPASNKQAPSVQKKHSPSLKNQIEQCFYYNARCIGFGVLSSAILKNSGLLPGQSDFLIEFDEILAQSLERLLETKGGRSATKYIPNSFKELLNRQPNSDTFGYIADMGELVFVETTNGGHQMGIAAQGAMLKRTAEIAISRCLTLLKVAMEENANDVVSVMLDDPSYLMALADYYLLLQANLMHIFHKNSAVFVPDESLVPESKSNQTLLRHWDYETKESSRMVPIPEVLKLILMESDNGRVATGHHRIGGKPGTIYRTGDPQAQEHLDRIAYSFVKGIEY